jgi:hypothetical protein
MLIDQQIADNQPYLQMINVQGAGIMFDDFDELMAFVCVAEAGVLSGPASGWSGCVGDFPPGQPP